MSKSIMYAIIAAMILLGADKVDNLLGSIQELLTTTKSIMPYLVVIIVGIAIYNANIKAQNSDVEMAQLIATRNAIIEHI